MFYRKDGKMGKISNKAYVAVLAMLSVSLVIGAVLLSTGETQAQEAEKGGKSRGDTRVTIYNPSSKYRQTRAFSD